MTDDVTKPPSGDAFLRDGNGVQVPVGGSIRHNPRTGTLTPQAGPALTLFAPVQSDHLIEVRPAAPSADPAPASDLTPLDPIASSRRKVVPAPAEKEERQ